MRMQTKFALLAAAGLLVLQTTAPAAQSGYDLFQKALAAERANGNLQQAIELYQRVVREFASDRALAARALLRMADCYAKLGNAQARAIYERIARAPVPDGESASARRRVDREQPQHGVPARSRWRAAWDHRSRVPGCGCEPIHAGCARSGRAALPIGSRR